MMDTLAAPAAEKQCSETEAFAFDRTMIDEQSRRCESDDDSAIIIELGDRSDDRFVAIVQSLLLIPALIIAWPDRWALAAGDQFAYAKLLLGCVFVGVWAFCVARCMAPPHPLTLRFDRNRLSYDSGRPGVKYLLDRFGDDFSGFYMRAFLRRRSWIIDRWDVRPSIAQVLTLADRIQVKPNDQSYDVMSPLPAELESMIVARISAWLRAEQSHATELAAGSDSNVQSSPPDR